MLEVHAQHAGFPLAEPTHVINGGYLCVVEGFLLIDGAMILVGGKAYADLKWHTAEIAWTNTIIQVAWAKTPPPLDATWSVDEFDEFDEFDDFGEVYARGVRDCPCLFIRSVRPLAMRVGVATSGIYSMSI